jgi:hypothetical protein
MFYFVGIECVFADICFVVQLQPPQPLDNFPRLTANADAAGAADAGGAGGEPGQDMEDEERTVDYEAEDNGGSGGAADY